MPSNMDHYRALQREDPTRAAQRLAVPLAFIRKCDRHGMPRPWTEDRDAWLIVAKKVQASGLSFEDWQRLPAGRRQ